MARIMVVEDDVYMREELIDLLRKSGYETASLFDFENAVSEITEYSPDLVLLDINLPFHSGFEICKELKAKELGTVLVLTARDKLQDELHALGLGADDYLTKPCNIERLLARIKNLLRRKEEQIRQGLLDGNGFLLDPNTFTIYVGKSSSLIDNFCIICRICYSSCYFNQKTQQGRRYFSAFSIGTERYQRILTV